MLSEEGVLDWSGGTVVKAGRNMYLVASDSKASLYNGLV